MTPERTELIPRRKLYQEVVDRLLARLRAGEFHSDGRMPSEREIMETYGVGRPAVREALLTLERMGLISIVHGERARVEKPTAQTMMDQIASTAALILFTSARHRGYLQDARLFFETGMARIAAENATAEDIARLRLALEDQAGIDGDLDAFGDCDMEFHREIARISGNAIFVAVSQSMSKWLQDFRRDLIQIPGAQNLTLAEHSRIVESIAAHDAAGAVEAMADHLNRSDELYRQFEHAPGVPPDAKQP